MATTFLPSVNGTTMYTHILFCYSLEDGISSFTVFALAKCLLSLPLCTFVLHVAFQRWRRRRQRSRSTAAATSPADVLTYHIVAMTLFGIFGSLAVCCGIHVADGGVIATGFYVWSFAWSGEISFHTLTCVERYFAIVHPIHYLKLKRGGGMLIRNISIVCAWPFSLWKTLAMKTDQTSTILLAFDHMFVLAIAFLCSVSVFCVLVRPVPGKQSRDGNGRTKQRAFIIIATSLCILFLRICWNFVLSIFVLMPKLSDCVTIHLGVWVTALSSLVTPLLFLHRAGKLARFRKALSLVVDNQTE